MLTNVSLAADLSAGVNPVEGEAKSWGQKARGMESKVGGWMLLVVNVQNLQIPRPQMSAISSQLASLLQTVGQSSGGNLNLANIAKAAAPGGLTSGLMNVAQAAAPEELKAGKLQNVVEQLSQPCDRKIKPGAACGSRCSARASIR